MHNVSVVIPCFNGEKYLKSAIESVLNQTGIDVEIIVVDDGSTDKTKDVVTAFPEVRYLYHENHGVSYSRNRGLEECSGEFVIFLDSDDLLPENRIKDDLFYFETNLQVGYVFGWHEEIDCFGRKVSPQKNENIVDAGFHTILQGKATVSPGAVTFKTALIRKVGGFSESIFAAEDFDLYLRFAREYPIYCHNRISLKYRRHDSNWSTIHGGKHTLESLLLRLKEQKNYIEGDAFLMDSMRTGVKHWKILIGPACVGELISNLKEKKFKRSYLVFIFLLKNCPVIFINSLFRKVAKRLNKQRSK